ncbi:MAG: ABC transporter permease [Micavibrio sp.]|nr:ABC transporter permease [Micavibrio sp.]
MYTLSPREIGTINIVGLKTLIKKEVGRFLAVYMQTIIAPVVTTLLYYTIFALAFGGVAREVDGVPFLQFLAPGLVMMTMVQNAFANTSSSIVIAKVQGNIVDVLLPPLSPLELYIGFTTGSVIRGLTVGTVTSIVMSFFVPMHIESAFNVIAFALMGTMMLGSLGLAGGIWSQKFDHIAAVTNFIVTPLTFLSGTFYSVNTLPEFWRGLATYNPFFYMIDGFRSGFIELHDSNTMIGLCALAVINAALGFLCYWMLKTGYKIKS